MKKLLKLTLLLFGAAFDGLLPLYGVSASPFGAHDSSP